MNANAYRNAIRDYIELLRKHGLKSQYITWQINATEVNDPTLVSNRAYGTRDHADVVMVACGVSGIWEPLPENEVILPTLQQIIVLRRIYGMGA